VKPVAQVAGVVLGATTAAAVVAIALGAVAAGYGLCDPKLGCSFGVQFGALVAAVVGFLIGLVLLCAFGAYSSLSTRVLPARVKWVLALGAGVAAGAALSIGALVSYS
jgi:hypothetical protein